MLNAASWIEAAEGHGERLNEPDCVVAALYVTVGNRLERTPMARSVRQAASQHDRACRTERGNMGARCRPRTTVGGGLPAGGDPYRKGRRQRPASNIAAQRRRPGG